MNNYGRARAFLDRLGTLSSSKRPGAEGCQGPQGKPILTRPIVSNSIRARESALQALGSATTPAHEEEIYFPIRLLQASRFGCSACLHGSSLHICDWCGPYFPSSPGTGEWLSANSD